MGRAYVEREAIRWYMDCFRKVLAAHFAMWGEFGALTEEAMDAARSARLELRAALANMERIARL